MNRLKQMGIQRWQLRKPGNGELSVRPERQHEHEETVLQADSSEVVAIDDVSGENSTDVSSVNAVTPATQNISAADSVNEQNTLNSHDTVAENTQGFAQYNWQQLAELFQQNCLCDSCKRSNPILGDGSLDADWVFVIDGPSDADIRAQQLMSGRAGQLFDAILSSVGMDRDSIYLTSVFKCPPSKDLGMAAQCGDVVHRQLELLEPKVIMTLGEFAAQRVLRSNHSLVSLRENNHRSINDGAAVVPSYSPVELLQEPQLKATVWLDLKECLAQLSAT